MTVPHSTAPDRSNGKFHIFIQVALLLAAITGVEMILIFVPLPRWIVVISLVILSAVKFSFVIFAFMHLRWDRLFCTLLFLIGLTVAAGILWALLQLFSSSASLPPENASNAVVHVETPRYTIGQKQLHFFG